MRTPRRDHERSISGYDELARAYDRGYDHGYERALRDVERDRNRDRTSEHRMHRTDDLRDYERNRGRGRVIDSDFDDSYNIGPHDDRGRGTAYDTPRDYGRTFERGWDRRPDGERISSEYGWASGNRAREWEHDEEFDERGLKRRW